MPDRPSSRSLRVDDDRARPRDGETPAAPQTTTHATAEPGAPPRRTFATATHESLFEPDAPACDVCGAALGPDADDEAFAPPGKSVFLVARGDDVRFDERPLCGDCATALGVTALDELDDGDDEE